MLLLSFAVVASLKTVGVILVVAMLITPAATALLISDKLQRVIIIAGLVGLFSAILGLILAIYLETTPGPAMAVMATIFYLIAVIFAPKKGLLFKTIAKQQTKQKVELEDTLKQTLKLHERKELSLSNLVQRLGWKENKVKSQLNQLKRKGLINFSNNQLLITNRGIEQANKLVRAHRLWETYLVEQLGLNNEQIHDDAERFEHILTDELVDDLEHNLGYPTVDPHGSPIPKKNFITSLKLNQIAKNHTALIETEQSNQSISTELWKLGLMPQSEILVLGHKKDTLKIRQGNKTIEISNRLAEEISVKELMER
jgi:Mn-dependent DtxR family transcriptional regulator